MVNYLSKFSAWLSELAEPIHELSKEKVPFNWGPEHDEAFQLIKKEIMVAPILAYYNPNKPTILQTNTSCKGLGACLLQNEKLMYFASKALTEMQKGYVVIELESLAVAWVMEKFHHFLYGNKFTLETNQKPLEVILSKSLNQATPRLQRILIRTFLYHFKISTSQGQPIMLQTAYPGWESKKTLYHYLSCTLIRLLVSSKQEVTVYITYD